MNDDFYTELTHGGLIPPTAIAPLRVRGVHNFTTLEGVFFNAMRKDDNMIDLKQGDCLELMKEIPDKSVDAIVTDPPYEYLKHKLDRPFDEQAVFNEWDRIVKDDGFLVFFGRGASFHRWNYLLNEMGWNFKEEIVWDKRRNSNPFGKLQRIHETVSVLTKKERSENHVFLILKKISTISTR